MRGTPSGKVQLYDERLTALGFDPMPAYREPDESPTSTPLRAEEYPLIITTGAREPVFRHSELRNIPIIMTTSLDELDSVVKCIELGAEDYLNKPVNPILLRARVNASLEKKQLRDEHRKLIRTFTTKEVAEELHRRNIRSLFRQVAQEIADRVDAQPDPLGF